MVSRRRPVAFSPILAGSRRTATERYKYYPASPLSPVILIRRLSPETGRAVAIINRRPAVTQSTGRYIFYAVYEAVDVVARQPGESVGRSARRRPLHKPHGICNAHLVEYVDSMPRSAHSSSRSHIDSDNRKLEQSYRPAYPRRQRDPDL